MALVDELVHMTTVEVSSKGRNDIRRYFIRGVAGDENQLLHVDTFFPSIKVWLIENNDAENWNSKGALKFVVGSHRNSAEKLRWIQRFSVDANSTRCGLHTQFPV